MSINFEDMSKLGFGLMRLPMKQDEIDMGKLCNMVDVYLENGFKYFDTAYMYHGGASETAIGEALVKRYPREAFYLATKLSPWHMNTLEDRDRILMEQMQRTSVDYFDFYLLHSIEDGPIYEKFVRLDCFSWAIKKKAEGKIKHFGFSFHGSPQLLEEILEEHPEVEFVQIQLNYADWKNPVVRSGELYEILHKRKIPMIIMEPVKGGILAQMDSGMAAPMKEFNPNASLASWALRFAASLEGVATVLSGMSNEEQMEDNLKTFKDFKLLTEDEKEVLKEVVRRMMAMPLVPCTSCRYCCEGCPASIAIPDVFRSLNTQRLYPKDVRAKIFYDTHTMHSGKAGDCLSCGRCENICPQHLPIIQLMKEAAETFDIS